MRKKAFLIVFVALMLFLFSACAQKTEEKAEQTLAPETPSHARVEETPSPTQAMAPQTTLAPEETPPPETTTPESTIPPETSTPETTPAPTTPPPTTAPATEAPETTPAPTTPLPEKEILEIYNVKVSSDPNGKIVFEGKIRNNGNDYQFNVKAVAILYDEFENVIDTEKSVPIAELAPGESGSFKITPNVLKSKVARYELKGESDTIKPEIPEVQKKISMEIFDVKESVDPNGKLIINGKLRNNGTATAFNVYVTATLYDAKGMVMKVEKSFPFDSIAPGEARSFKITSSILSTNVARYELRAEWEEAP